MSPPKCSYVARSLALGVLLGGLIGPLGRTQAQTALEAPLPEFFGFYIVTGNSLREIPETDPALTAVTREEQKDDEGAVRLLSRLVDHCTPVKGQLTFILYHELIKPETFKLTQLIRLSGVSKPAEIRLGIAPLGEKKFMYRLVPRQPLEPGLYVVGASADIFSVYGTCVNLDASADELRQSMRLALQRGSQPPPPTSPGTQPAGPLGPAPSAPISVAASCGDYTSCLGSATAAFQSSQWEQSLALLQRASALEPTKPDPWAEMGRIYLATGRYEEAAKVWDKALSLGGTLALPVWHSRGMHRETGTFSISAKDVSFVGPSQEKVFSVPPGQVSSLTSGKAALSTSWLFYMKVGGKGYRFYHAPLGATCEKPAYKCEEPGPDQMAAVAKYIELTIPKLASGAFSVTH